MRKNSRVNPGETKRIARQKYGERQIEKWYKWSWNTRGKVKYKELVEYLGEVLKAGARARDLVAQMLAFSQGGEGKLEAHVLSLLITESLKMLGTTLPSSVEMELHLDDGEITIMTNPVQIHQLVMNLCINARDAMESDGKLTIETRDVHLPAEDLVDKPWTRSREFVELCITDNGCVSDVR